MRTWCSLTVLERDTLVTLQRIPSADTSITQLIDVLDEKRDNSPAQASVSQALEKLDEKGLVRRFKSAADLRRTRLEVTADGQRALEERCEQMIDAVGWQVLQPTTEDDLITNGGVFVTEHAADRWDQRTPFHSVAPEIAWEQSERRTDLCEPGSFAEVRLHRPTGVVLGRNGPAIVTVLPRGSDGGAGQEVQG